MDVPVRPGPLAAGQTRDAIVAEVRRGLRPLARGAALIIACSAGADSTALAALVDEARPDLSLTLVHVDHGIRDTTERDADHVVVRTLGAWLGCDVEVVELALPPDAHAEEPARLARHAALAEVAARVGAPAVAYGHTAHDQAETVVLRLARGTGVAGLGAMQPWTPTDVHDGGGVHRVRPLLRFRREDVHAFVAGEGLPTHHDHTNDDDTSRRVRVRRELLPALERLADDPVGAIGRLADLARADAASLDRAAREHRGAQTSLGEVTLLRRKLVQGADPAIGRRLVRDALVVAGARGITAQLISDLLATEGMRVATLAGGIRFRADREWWTFERLQPSNRAAPGTAARDRAARDMAAPEMAAPETAARDRAAPGTAAPEVRASDPATPELGTADVASPDVTVWGPGEPSGGFRASRIVGWPQLGIAIRMDRDDAGDGRNEAGDDGCNDAAGDGRNDDGDAVRDGTGDGTRDAGYRHDQIAFALPGTWAPPAPPAPAIALPGFDPAFRQLVLAADTPSMSLRAPQPGDRLQTAAGRVRLVELLRAAGVPRALRSRWPVVVAAHGPVWLPGIAVDATLAAGGRAAPAVALTVVMGGASDLTATRRSGTAASAGITDDATAGVTDDPTAGITDDPTAATAGDATAATAGDADAGSTGDADAGSTDDAATPTAETAR